MLVYKESHGALKLVQELRVRRGARCELLLCEIYGGFGVIAMQWAFANHFDELAAEEGKVKGVISFQELVTK